MIPQILLLGIFLISLLFAANKHGQPRERYNFWAYFISAVLELGLLYWGGFFDVFAK